MEDHKIKRLQYVVVIAEKKKKGKLMTLLGERGAHEVELIYGKGSAGVGFLAKAFGLDMEDERVYLSCLLPDACVAPLMQTLYEDFDFKKSNTGIAFSVPVEGLMF